MEQFVICASESYRWWNRSGGLCLDKDTSAFCHSDYHGGGNWKLKGTVENLICTLKNDRTPYSRDVLTDACQKLREILSIDLPQISRRFGFSPFTVCVIPRAKHEHHYAPNQLLFRTTVQNYVINAGLNFFDGTSNIIRHTDTRTTHSDRSGNGGNGPKPYPGITKDTYDIKNIQGKDILLIDDLYTKHICIDEDAIQALYDNGANRVVFYSVGKTVSN